MQDAYISIPADTADMIPCTSFISTKRKEDQNICYFRIGCKGGEVYQMCQLRLDGALGGCLTAAPGKQSKRRKIKIEATAKVLTSLPTMWQEQQAQYDANGSRDREQECQRRFQKCEATCSLSERLGDGGYSDAEGEAFEKLVEKDGNDE